MGKIKNANGKYTWLFGGARLTISLLNLKLVEEISLAVHPVLLGAGKPLFSEIHCRVQLKMAYTKTYSTGLFSLTYHLAI